MTVSSLSKVTASSNKQQLAWTEGCWYPQRNGSTGGKAKVVRVLVCCRHFVCQLVAGYSRAGLLPALRVAGAENVFCQM